MGSGSQLRFVARYADALTGPFLEAGSRDYGNTQNLRGLLAARKQSCRTPRVDIAADYVGVDMLDGPGVDVTADLAGDFAALDRALGGRRFGTVFCLSVLEHCRNPFAMAANIERLLLPGGKLCVSAPFAFRLHAYPDDYWRFTPAGLRELFGGVEFKPQDCFWTTGRGGKNEFRPIDEQLGKIPFSFSTHRREGHILRGLAAKMLGVLGKLGPLSWLAGYRYLLAPTDIIMMGTLQLEHISKDF